MAPPLRSSLCREHFQVPAPFLLLLLCLHISILAPSLDERSPLHSPYKIRRHLARHLTVCCLPTIPCCTSNHPLNPAWASTAYFPTAPLTGAHTNPRCPHRFSHLHLLQTATCHLPSSTCYPHSSITNPPTSIIHPCCHPHHLCLRQPRLSP